MLLTPHSGHCTYTTCRQTKQRVVISETITSCKARFKITRAAHKALVGAKGSAVSSCCAIRVGDVRH
ncbi:hypothetical protein GQ44DRAFT_189474 [Phaeosphaeriaceae sp. PMI808]|nr:hypothetical protein GQ44DRAFT_189474 [Phaeosphaeriaceae sp. PMI808]